jgi:hypothetical protein
VGLRDIIQLPPHPGEIVMVIKILTILFLLTILYSLASSLFFLVRDKGEGDRTVKRLTWRIGLSLVLFISLWGAYKLDWIEPSSGPVRIPPVVEKPDGP